MEVAKYIFPKEELACFLIMAKVNEKFEKDLKYYGLELIMLCVYIY